MRYEIWSNDLDYADWKDDLESHYPNIEGFTEDDRIRIMYEINDEYLEDEQELLNMELNQPVVIVAELGLWNGIRKAYKFMRGTNLNDIFKTSVGDYVTWYVEDEELKCDDTHHDGTNHYTYRLLKPEYSMFDFQEYATEISGNAATEKFTEPLGHFVTEIYGVKGEQE